MCVRQSVANLLLVLCAGLALPCGAEGQDIQFGMSGDSNDTVVWEVAHRRLLGCRSDCPECRAYRQRCRGHVGGRTVCPPGSYPTVTPESELAQPVPEAEGAQPSPESQDITAPVPEPSAEQVAQGLLPSSFGGGRGVLGASPGMIGDFFSFGGQQMAIESLGQDANNPTSISLAGGDRRFKIVENNSPFPVDRVFFNYHHFENALIPADAIAPAKQRSLDRYLFGIEKTFLDKLWSVELRIPFARGLSSTQFVDPVGPNRSFDHELNSDTTFGNLALAIKRLVWSGPAVAVSIGMGIVAPTADDMLLFPSPQFTAAQLLVENEAWYLQPFFGLRYAPGDRFWFDFFTQADFDANGNRVTLTLPNSSGPVQRVLTDQNLLFLDGSLGYWLYRDPCGCSLVSGLAPIIELHYSTTMQDTDFVAFDSFGQDTLTNPFNRMDVLNLTGGLRVKFRQRSYLTVAAAAPLRANNDAVLERDSDRVFDAEVGVQFVRLY